MMASAFLALQGPDPESRFVVRFAPRRLTRLTGRHHLLWARSLLFGLATTLVASGCSTTEVVKANSTPAIQSSVEIAAEDVLDLGIVELDPGIPQEEPALEKSLIVPDVRRAESRFIAYHLKNTLEQTGNWGAVRVTPADSRVVDVIIAGEILLSDGERLRVRLSARDATGKHWFTNEYEDGASKFSYRQTQEDPFQDLYNEFANDLLAYRSKLDARTIANIRTVAGLQYAASLSPESFGGYLQKTGKTVSVLQLPADGDPMVRRINRIKDRELLFVDTLDEYYDRFYREMSAPYRDWRAFTYDEAIKLRQMQKQSRNRLLTGAALIAGGLYASTESGTYAGQAAAAGAVVGGIAGIRSGLQRRADAEVHAASLRELSESLGGEITPIVLDVEGRTIELKGTADTQYAEWQRILKDIYAEDNVRISE